MCVCVCIRLVGCYYFGPYGPIVNSVLTLTPRLISKTARCTANAKHSCLGVKLVSDLPVYLVLNPVRARVSVQHSSPPNPSNY